jgi:hypothetical protein
VSVALPLIQAVYTTGATLYAVLHDSIGGKVFNATNNGWEAYNQAHWSQYAIALTEQTGSGYYTAQRPAIASGYLTTECIYLQAGAGPASTDAPPILLGYSAGQNIAAISGDPTNAPTNLQAVLASQTQGQIASGTISSSSFPTGLTNANAGAYQGRVIYFVTGAAAGMAGLIANYDPSNGTITLSGSLAVAPGDNDQFIIA